MNPPCARCDKIVYPTEKVSCLDKVWHKACFHCEVCKMTLQMKNYKGYDKKPYCSAHYPKQTFTTVADTPENLRLKQQSELQSQVKYKEDFEKSRGKAFSLVPDTPELRRMKKAQEQISNVKYQDAGVVPVGAAAPDRPAGGRAIPGGRHAGYPQLGKAAVGGGQARQTSAAPQQGTLPPMTAPHPLHHRPSVDGTFRALYDYVAADEDELSFAEGELFCNVQRIDDGWLYGTVARTGATGMLPANYVERT
ncbi:LIM and SH3 domain protein 1-like [Lethenteron reissneri]|uniref:LIM and SH3 domain protein 1-like n=1 Tax=Lethenteron reissneri TaxID=7753 RepID=UPI002AB7456A|nr:LIM and SH3 domain protein 1-like [Lethenteron reissneri]